MRTPPGDDERRASPMSVAGSQQRTFLALAAQLRPHWRRDRALPARIQTLLARQRAFGSRDRRLYRELLYTTLRYLPWLESALDREPDLAVQIVAWLAADSRATEHFRKTFLTDWPPCPPTVAEKSAEIARRLSLPAADSLPSPLPDWFRDHCPEAFAPAQLDALLARAPLWLRLQTSDTARVTDEFTRLGWRYEFSSVLPTALQLLDEVDVTKTAAYERGLIEVQDLGSQLLLESAGIAPARGEPVASGQRWLDACAGAGGKALQLAALLGPTGHVDAHDIRPAALRELALRATRAGIPVSSSSPVAAVYDRRSEKPSSDPGGHRPPLPSPRTASLAILATLPPATALYDGVLVDAPCSGTGTWRRAPHLKWTTTPAQIAAAAAQQLAILSAHAPRVRPGGRLLYATCSLSHCENEDVIAAFLAAHPAFATEPPAHAFGATVHLHGLTFLPATHDTDGFFLAALRRQA